MKYEVITVVLDIAHLSKFASVKAAHVLFFWCLCDYCVLVFLCYWESIN